MVEIIMLSLDELRKLERGEVVTCECRGRNTKIVCTDSFRDAITMIELEENKGKEDE